MKWPGYDSYDLHMRDHFSNFVISVVLWVCWGLFFEFLFRRSEDARKRSVAPAAGVMWLCITAWMVYSFVMWRRLN